MAIKILSQRKKTTKIEKAERSARITGEKKRVLETKIEFSSTIK